MIKAIFLLTAITFVPMLELRASIPFGIFGMAKQISWLGVVCVCVVANILLGWLFFLVLDPVFRVLRKWKWFDKALWPRLLRAQRRIHPYVEKYGEMGVAIFIGIPLPGSGVYTGALGSYLLGVQKKKFMVANAIGVLIAAVAVTGLSLLILKGAVGKESWLVRLFLKTEI